MTDYLLAILIALTAVNVLVAYRCHRPRYYIRVGEIEIGANTKWELDDLLERRQIFPE